MEIDEDLHSRQLAVYGRETMQRMAASSILISGLNGLGCEIAKNVILAGVRSVTLHDAAPVQIADLSSQFYLTEADIGKNRADACFGMLQSLNPGVIVKILAEPLTDAHIAAFQVVVFADHQTEDLCRINEFCRSQPRPISFIKCESRGLSGNVFCDFGAGFVVHDTDGEEPITGIVASISNDNPALVTFIEDERIEFEEGDFVVFAEVEGMTELNDNVPRRIQSVNKKQRTITVDLGDSHYSPYARGGVVTSVKQPKTLNFLSLRERLQTPGEILMYDFAKMEAPLQLHIAYLALDAFQRKNGGLPRSFDENDAATLIELAKEANAALPSDVAVSAIDENLVKKVSFTARGNICPLAAILGGMAAQEVLKATSGKFHPLFQWFYFDAFECIDDSVPLSPEEFAATNSRYDGQIACLGSTMQKKLGNLKIFLVGAGALGCEFLKNFALMGVACGPNGKLTVTDDDTIEKSNLSRQFLFRDKHISQSKSTVAASSAQAINASLRVTALQNRVSSDTETVFNDSFWEGLDVVTNALDNVNARLYVDSRCVYFQRPLLESGTLGAKCNTQMVLPLMTEHYGASRDPPEKQAPMCTIHQFPHVIDHCLTWARSEFEGLFEKTPTDVNGWLSKPDYDQMLSQQNPGEAREALTKVRDCLVQEKCSNFEDCIRWARLRFEEYNVNRILQLVHSLPEDAVTSSGIPFWSPPKRFPRAIRFDKSDPVHRDFVVAGANLRAEIFGLEKPDWNRDAARIAEIASTAAVPEFVPKKGIKIDIGEKKEGEQQPAQASAAPEVEEGDTEQVRQLMEALSMVRPSLGSGFRMQPVAFEKDNDANFHMDFIAAAANLRARVYSIPEVDKLKAKLIAGRIIPAIATATALAAGLVCLELFKVVASKPVETFRNSFVNLALPLITMSEPAPPKKTKFLEHEWSIWDRWVIPGEPTMQDMLDWFKTTRGISASVVSYNAALLYAHWMPAHKSRLPKKLTDLAREVGKVEFPAGKNFIDFVVACEDENENDVDVPLISVRLPK